MKILDKLRKLINHEKSAREIGSVGEAANFAEKIQELLDNYNLSFADVDINDERSTLDQSEQGLHAINRWQSIFIINLAEINGCRCIFFGTLIKLVGLEEDRLITFELYDYFEKLARDFAAEALKNWKITPEYHRKRKKVWHSKSFKKSYLHGFVVAIITRLRERHDAAMKASSNETALIFIGNKLAEAGAFVDRNIQLKKSTPIKKIKSSEFKTDAFDKGLKAGHSVALTHKTVE